MYNTPELILVGTASALVLDTSPGPFIDPKCSVVPDVPTDDYLYIDESAW